MKRELPETVTATAFQSKNGEYAWPRKHITEALHEIVKIEQAILGGEVWVVRDGKIRGLIPDVAGGPPAVWGWTTLSKQQEESWHEFCHRTLKESVEAIESMKVEENSRADVRDYLFFNVTYITESEYTVRGYGQKMR